MEKFSFLLSEITILCLPFPPPISATIPQLMILLQRSLWGKNEVILIQTILPNHCVCSCTYPASLPVTTGETRLLYLSCALFPSLLIFSRALREKRTENDLSFLVSEWIDASFFLYVLSSLEEEGYVTLDK